MKGSNHYKYNMKGNNFILQGHFGKPVISNGFSSSGLHSCTSQENWALEHLKCHVKLLGHWHHAQRHEM